MVRYFLFNMFGKETYFLLYWISLQIPMALKETLLTSLLFRCLMAIGINMDQSLYLNAQCRSKTCYIS